ncbi:MAG: arginine--tRNA ligase [Deltaproteobacteria bacterium HGW-Deltaproteobacteria-19]|jgi:arginyl-tRNA synthetase|nr:MAG: arginine--tRNA ligase [Deltaproteobacteria bacterium HGW-Deltaproteobacteria-19]
MKRTLQNMLSEALAASFREGLLPSCEIPPLEVDWTKDPAHGDYASNAAMILASRLKRKPRQIAEILVAKLGDSGGGIQKMEIAGPGFINFFIEPAQWYQMLGVVEERSERFGMSDLGGGRSMQVEFVSANPTGPLHIGHARGAVVGDVIANILAATGHSVFREYYINDAGNQMNNLGRSVYYRYLQLLGEAVEFPENGYQGDYITGLAREIMDRDGDRYRVLGEQEAVPVLSADAGGVILEGIKDDLKAFGVVFDLYFSERELYKDNGVAKLLEELKQKDFIYEEEGTLWFRTTAYGDEKDRVVVRQNGEPTYFAADIAYHRNKFARGFDTVIDIWGADHHGYIPRMMAGIQALGHEREALQVILVQLVSLLRDGKPVAMSTRAGEFVTLRQVVDEVGKDAARYNFLMRRSDSHLDFDLEVAKRQSNENPVYYVQYAHARICSIFRTAAERGFVRPARRDVDPSVLKLDEEIALIKAIVRYPEVVEAAALALEPHRLTFYLNDLAGLFHSYYNRNKVLSEDDPLSMARLFLVTCIQTVLRNGLDLLGVTAPVTM